jgi:hypothetical protein
MAMGVGAPAIRGVCRAAMGVGAAGPIGRGVA